MPSRHKFLLGRGLYAGVTLLWSFLVAGLLALMLAGLGDAAGARAFQGLSLGLGICLFADVCFVVACLAYEEAA